MVESETQVLVKNLEDENHIQHSYFMHEKFHDRGRFDPRFLILIGFLYCRHKSVQSAERAMWGLINRKINDTVELKDVEAFLKDIAFLAINLPKNYYETKLRVAQEKHEASGHTEEYITPEEKATFAKIIKYLDDCNANAEKACNNILRALGSKPITQERLYANFSSVWYAASTIRTFVNPKGGRK